MKEGREEVDKPFLIKNELGYFICSLGYFLEYTNDSRAAEI